MQSLLSYDDDNVVYETNGIVVAPYNNNNNNNNITTTTTTATTSSSSRLPPVLDLLLFWFQGDFDNYRQVVVDRTAGLLPREYGGHEHIHCSLIPVTYTSRLAAFYFDGTPDAIFRFRFYRLQTSTDHGSTVDTILYTLAKELETKLRLCSDVMQWPNIFQQHVRDQVCDTTATTGTFATEDNDDIVDWAIRSSSVTILPNCEVRWSRERDAIQHSYVNDSDDNISKEMISSGLHAIMVHNEALVDSQMIPGQKILIKDQLSLWDDQLWIHDRGYNPDTGAFIYGNQNGIPYRMQRVTDMVCTSSMDEVKDSNSISNKVMMDKQQRQQPERRITDNELAWTLGNDYRTPIEYEANMQIIGGSSRRI